MPYRGYQDKAFRAKDHGAGMAMPCAPTADPEEVAVAAIGLMQLHPDWSHVRCRDRAAIEVLKMRRVYLTAE